MGRRARDPSTSESRGTRDDAPDDAHAVLRSDIRRNYDLAQALDDYRAGFKDLQEAAQEAGIPKWDLLEAAQATPDPLVRGAKPALTELPTFVRRRDEERSR